MPAFQPGDPLLVTIETSGRKGNKQKIWKEGTVVYTGPKFVTVELGNYRGTYGYNEIRAV